MKKAIFLSIKPQYCKLIESQKKVNEFRTFIPKEEVEYFWIYESAPTSALKYIAKVSKPISYPNKIAVIGDGDDRFNMGLTKYKYAYTIESLYKLATPLSLNFLRKEFNFYPPQGYSYLRTYSDLVEYVDEKIPLKKVF
ncbi:hypothetical protein ACFQ38_08925 [Sporosarcina contaminans]|uniref:Uncharacterized protein n=1 Tax=Sporosarcina contaminans TaxID=633403 RepID=A0ABW3TWK7_9BACL